MNGYQLRGILFSFVTKIWISSKGSVHELVSILSLCHYKFWTVCKKIPRKKNQILVKEAKRVPLICSPFTPLVYVATYWNFKESIFNSVLYFYKNWQRCIGIYLQLLQVFIDVSLIPFSNFKFSLKSSFLHSDAPRDEPEKFILNIWVTTFTYCNNYKFPLFPFRALAMLLNRINATSINTCNSWG